MSCESGEGIDAPKAALTDKISIFVGQSGVGKSSLTNALMPGLDAHRRDLRELGASPAIPPPPRRGSTTSERRRFIDS